MQHDQQRDRVQLRLMFRRAEVLQRERLDAAELRLQQVRLIEKIERLLRARGLGVVADAVAEPRHVRIVAEERDAGQDVSELARRRDLHHAIQRIRIRHAEEAVLAAADRILGQQLVARIEEQRRVRQALSLSRRAESLPYTAVELQRRRLLLGAVLASWEPGAR